MCTYLCHMSAHSNTWKASSGLCESFFRFVLMAEKENEKETEKEKAAEKEKKEKPVTIKQLSKLRLGRESLEKWINEKDFEEIIQGCFVRVLLGEKQGKRLYRIAVIRGVQNSDAVYKIGDSFTTKLLVLNSGNAHKTFKMDFISNGDFTADEYKEWQEQMQKCGLPPLTTKDVDRKIKHIKSFVQKKKLQAQAAASAPKADDTEPAQLEPPADEASKEQSAVKRPPEEPLDDSEAPAKRQRVADIVTREESVEEPIEDKNLKPPAQEVVEVDAAVEGIEEEVPPGPDYNTALANANSYYNIVQGHHDEQSQYLAELQEANTELKDCIASLQQHMGELATELDKKRTAAGEMLDDGSVWEEEATRELAERQKGYEEVWRHSLSIARTPGTPPHTLLSSPKYPSHMPHTQPHPLPPSPSSAVSSCRGEEEDLLGWG